MMPTSRQEGVSSRKRNAKRRTKARAEDLHMAGKVSRWIESELQVSHCKMSN
jgi:hypothetical protein